MQVANGTATNAEVRAIPGPSGGGPDDWRPVAAGGQLYLDLPANTLWQVECRAAGTQLSSTLLARSDDEIQLVLSGARLRPQRVSKEPLQV